MNLDLNRTLDLNVQRPTLTLTFKNETHDVLNVTTPEERMVQKLQNSTPMLDKLKKGDKDSIDGTYDLMAELLSFNLDNVEVTAADLRGKYKVGLMDLILITGAYLDFINALMHEKN